MEMIYLIILLLLMSYTYHVSAASWGEIEDNSFIDPFSESVSR